MNNNVVMVKLKEGKSVYTRSVGKGMPILLLHGGPGADSRKFEEFEDYIDLEKFQLIYYNQLGSTYSDEISADEKHLATIERFTDEVEQVRQGLGLEEFILLGHSWGVVLAIEYALKYQYDGHLKGVVFSNMTCDMPREMEYMLGMMKKLLTQEEFDYVMKKDEEEDYDDKRYLELFEKFYAPCSCRIQYTPKRGMEDFKVALVVYNEIQGRSPFIVKGSLKNWDRSSDLKNIKTKALAIGAKHDHVNPEIVKDMAEWLDNAEFLYCENGSHSAYIDDAKTYFDGLNKFLNECLEI